MDFVLVGTLLLIVVIALVQFTLALWVRTVLIDAAGEGARYGALNGVPVAEGAQRAREVAGMTLGTRYVDSSSASIVPGTNYDLVVVEITAPLPLIGLIGPSGTVSVMGRAISEE